ncbi:MAG: hypothetical protein FWD69_10525 [Polyangiaceae bacterium]|nr:hypothetical protein [Polyangiaceae bacterium]
MGLVRLAGYRATSARVTLPAWGAWYAEVSIDVEAQISGAVDLALADATFKGTVLSGGPAKGRSNFRIVGGNAGWGKEIPKKGYANDAGVKLSTVLRDAAQEASEALDMSTVDLAATAGSAFARRRDAACRVLERLVPGAWYIGEDGVTRLGRRPTTPYTGVAVRVTPIDLARGTITLAAESLKELVPGVVVDELEAVDVVHDVSQKGLRTQIYGKRGTLPTSRGLAAMRLILEQLDPDRAYRGIYEYRVVTLAGNRVNLQPVLVSTGMPDLLRVPIRPGLAGSSSDLVLGARVLVGFVNSDPGRPVVLAFEDADGEGFTPLRTSIDAQALIQIGGGVRPVAATGDLAGGIWPIAATQVKVQVP